MGEQSPEDRLHAQREHLRRRFIQESDFIFTVSKLPALSRKKELEGLFDLTKLEDIALWALLNEQKISSLSVVRSTVEHVGLENLSIEELQNICGMNEDLMRDFPKYEQE